MGALTEEFVALVCSESLEWGFVARLREVFKGNRYATFSVGVCRELWLGL